MGQPVLKGTGWVEDFNPSTHFGPSRPAHQLDEPKYGLGHPDPLVSLKKIKIKVIKKINFLWYIF